MHGRISTSPGGEREPKAVYASSHKDSEGSVEPGRLFEAAFFINVANHVSFSL